MTAGHAAHAMSPVGGVGIDLAVPDAVTAATLLAGPLRRGRPTPEELAKVRARRLLGLGVRPEHAPPFARRSMEPVK